MLKVLLLISTIIALSSECPPGVPIAMCFADPCQVNKCSAYPTAKCKANYCGGCLAEWYLDGVKIDCSKPPETKLCLFPVQCFIEPCKFASCPAYPNAKCVNNYCGGCNAFFYENGVKVDC